jgi:DNA polymerase-3 subunit alpha
MRLKLLLQYLYIDKENANAHDILLCVREGEKHYIGRGRGYRFGLLIRNTISRREEMKKLFTDFT